MIRHTARRQVRPRRRPGAAMLALLWLLIALMPLRALSQELMGAAQRSAPSTAVPMAVMPCHAGVGHAQVDLPAMHHAPAADALNSADVAAGDEPAANCNACDLCHAALAGPVCAAPDLSVPAASRQVATPTGPSAAVAPDGIFKPPRG